METKKFEKMVAEEIDFEPLEIEIARRLGIMGVKIEGGIKETQRPGDPLIRFETNGLLSETGLFQTIFSSVTVRNFGGDFIIKAGQEFFGKKENYFWVPVYIDWKRKNGGSNGVHLFDARYYPAIKIWKFE